LGTRVPGNERPAERKFPGTKSPGNESFRERKISGTNVPHRHYSFLRTKGLGYDKSVIQAQIYAHTTLPTIYQVSLVEPAVPFIFFLNLFQKRTLVTTGTGLLQVGHPFCYQTISIKAQKVGSMSDYFKHNHTIADSKHLFRNF